MVRIFSKNVGESCVSFVKCEWCDHHPHIHAFNLGGPHTPTITPTKHLNAQRMQKVSRSMMTTTPMIAALWFILGIASSYGSNGGMVQCSYPSSIHHHFYVMMMESLYSTYLPVTPTRNTLYTFVWLVFVLSLSVRLRFFLKFGLFVFVKLL